MTQWFISRTAIIFQGSMWGPTVSGGGGGGGGGGGVQPFSGGSNCLFLWTPIELVIFQWGSEPLMAPPPPDQCIKILSEIP